MKKYNINLTVLKQIVKESNSFIEVTEKLGYDNKNKSTIRTIERIIKRNKISSNHFNSVKRFKKWKNVTEKKLIELIDKHDTMKDILLELDLTTSTKNYQKLKYYFNKYELKPQFKFNKTENFNNIYDEKKLKKIVSESFTYKEVCKKLGLSTRGNNNKTIKKYIKRFNIDNSHFNPQKGRIEALSKYWIKHNLIDILVENSTYTSTTNLKKRLYDENLKKRECEFCGQNEIWRGKKISLILDHINGINNDHRLENLRILCPNCNATLDTHCGKLSYKERQKRILSKKEKYINYSKSTRKVNRPSYEILMNEIKNMGYSATGRKYGVSDNAIRKWVNFYEKYEYN